MSVPTSRPFSSPLLDDLLAFCGRNAIARPEAAYLRPGDVVWRLPLHRLATLAPQEPLPSDNASCPSPSRPFTPSNFAETAKSDSLLGEVPWLRLWFDAKGIAGYAWFEPPTGVELDLRTDLDWNGEVGNALLDWAETKRQQAPAAYPWLVDVQDMEQWAAGVRERPVAPHGGRWLTTLANENDTDRLAALHRRGYERTGHHAILYARNLADPLPAPDLPPPYRIRHTTGADIAARVAVHRAAWVGSTWTIERYAAMRATPAYDETLDLVVEAEPGHFAACCICWPDPVSRSGSFEPVGTRPAFRGRGITRELIHEGLRRLAAKGMTTAHTETPGFNTPAQALYESSGFERAGVRWTYMKEINGFDVTVSC